jgi:hypothetical protein
MVRNDLEDLGRLLGGQSGWVASRRLACASATSTIPTGSEAGRSAGPA